MSVIAPAQPDRMYATPDRSLQQRMEALRRANAVRSYRSALKRQLKAGEGRSLVAILRAPEEELATMKVFELMLAAPKFGRVKVNKMLAVCRISPSKTVAGLSLRQREDLITLLSGGVVRRQW